MGDGIFASWMIGFTQDYFTPFLLHLGGTVRDVGLLSSLPNIIGSISQFKAGDIVALLKSRKRAITSFVFLQAMALLAMALMAGGDVVSTTMFITLVVLFTTFGAVSNPAWGSLMSDLVPENKRGSYFGWRNSVLGTVIVVASVSGGVVLHLISVGTPRRGFVILFGSAFAARIISWIFLRHMYDPPMRHSRRSELTLRAFIARVRVSNFARFVAFVSLLAFTVNLAAPFFAVLMLRDLKFSYLTYSVIIVTATLLMYLMMARWGKIADIVGNVRVMKFTAPIISILPLLWVINRHPAFLIFAQVVSGFAWAGFNLAASNFIYDSVAPEKRVRYLSYFNVFNGLMLSAGAVTGGYLIGVLPPINGYPILMLFVISSVLRLIVSFTLPNRIREVRDVPSVKSDDLFFSVVGIKPLLGIERKTIGLLR